MQPNGSPNIILNQFINSPADHSVPRHLNFSTGVWFPCYKLFKLMWSLLDTTIFFFRFFLFVCSQLRIVSL